MGWYVMAFCEQGSPSKDKYDNSGTMSLDNNVFHVLIKKPWDSR